MSQVIVQWVYSDDWPCRPAEDAEEGTVHGGKPGFRIAFIEDDNGVWVGVEEFFGEEGAGDVEDALSRRFISDSW